MKKKTILITNDDGFESVGLKALKEALSPLANIIIVAPTIEKSACGHSLTLTRPLRFVKLEENFYKLDDGTPSDCIFLALKKMFEEKKPDLVVSGINLGANLGEDITYSGTAAAAMEAVLQGVPAIAFSQVCKKNCQNIDFEVAKMVAKEIVEQIFTKGYPLEERKFLNINIPPISLEEFKGVKITYAGKRAYGLDAQKHINPRGVEYYWIGLPLERWHKYQNDKHDISDFEAIENGYVSITPIQLDMTHYESLDILKRWL